MQCSGEKDVHVSHANLLAHDQNEMAGLSTWQSKNKTPLSLLTSSLSEPCSACWNLIWTISSLLRVLIVVMLVSFPGVFPSWPCLFWLMVINEQWKAPTIMWSLRLSYSCGLDWLYTPNTYNHHRPVGTSCWSVMHIKCQLVTHSNH